MPAPKNAPLYQQIYDEIKDAIEKGVYAPKERIPSELELAEQYDVSRITVRRAVEELCSDGYLVKQQGRGTSNCVRQLLQLPQPSASSVAVVPAPAAAACSAAASSPK